MAECGYLMESEIEFTVRDIREPLGEIQAAGAGPPCNRKVDPLHRRVQDAPTVPSPQACFRRRFMYRKYVWLWVCMWKTQRL